MVDHLEFSSDSERWSVNFIKVAHVGELAALGKILSKDNLRKWHVIVVEWCCMFKNSEE